MQNIPTDTAAPLPRVWLALTVSGCVSLVVSSLFDVFPMIVVSKLLASSSFLLIAVSVGALTHRVGQWMFAALVLSWVGDMLLLDKQSGLFLAGLASFLLAHVAYVVSFTLRGLSTRWLYISVMPITVAAFAVLVWLTPYLPVDMVVPVRAYVVAISIMAITAFAAWGLGATALIPVGALLFCFSDLSVAAGKFVQPEFPNFVWGLPFYYTGQILLALSAGPLNRLARTP